KDLSKLLVCHRFLRTIVSRSDDTGGWCHATEKRPACWLSPHFGSIEPKHEPEFWARIAGSQSGTPPWSRNSRRAAAGLTWWTRLATCGACRLGRGIPGI